MRLRERTELKMEKLAKLFELGTLTEEEFLADCNKLMDWFNIESKRRAEIAIKEVTLRFERDLTEEEINIIKRHYADE